MRTTESPDRMGDSLFELARKLHDFIASKREQHERERTLDPEVVEAMKDAGFFRMLQSKHFGGLERPPEEFCAVVSEVSTACPSTGWVLGILGVHPFEFAQMSVELQEELYGDDPNTLISSSYAPQSQVRRVPGGYRINGSHRSSSGVDFASWVVVGGAIPNEDPRTGVRSFLVPRKDFTVVDDWHVVGLSGTGSKRVVFDDVFVPEHRSISRYEIANGIGPGLAVNTSPLFKVPHAVIYTTAATAPAIGAAWAAYREALRQIGEYRPRTGALALLRGSYASRPAEHPLVHKRVARARSLIDGAELRAMRALREAYAKAEAGEEITLTDRARWVWDLAQAADDCLSAVRLVFETRGASVVYSSNPLQAYYRDLIAMRQHGTQDVDARSLAVGMAELGLPLESVAWI